MCFLKFIDNKLFWHQFRVSFIAKTKLFLNSWTSALETIILVSSANSMRQGKNYGTSFGLQQFEYFYFEFYHSCNQYVTLITNKYVCICLHAHIHVCAHAHTHTHTHILYIIISSICYKSKLQYST